MSRSCGRPWIAVVAVGLLLAGCAGGGSSSRSRQSDQRTLTAEEMVTAGYSDLFSAVQALRPRWLFTRGTSTINLQESIKVYIDESLLGGPEQLRQIAVQSVASLRYMDALEATNRWGLDHGLGAIMISTRRQ